MPVALTDLEAGDAHSHPVREAIRLEPYDGLAALEILKDRGINGAPSLLPCLFTKFGFAF
jgi:hypothetical protein